MAKKKKKTKKKAAKKAKPEMVRMSFDEGETGWAEVVGDHLVKICNIPFGGGLNIDDVVKVREDEDGWLSPVRVMERSMPVRTVIWYPDAAVFQDIANFIRKVGGKPEGAFGPREGKPGAIIAAFPREGLAEDVYDEFHIERPPDWNANEIEVDPRDWSPGK